MPDRFKRWALACLLMCAAALPASAYSAPKTVLVLGDSLSAEYGLARGTGWVALLERRLKQDKVDATVVNASISGETTIGGRNRLPALLKQYHPALVVIELGANDGLRGLPLKDAEANLRAMVDASRQAGAKPMLVGIRIPPNYGRDYTDKLAGLYPALAHEYKLPVVPFMLEGVADKPNLFQDDQLHPVAQAHPIILANIWPVLSKALASR